MNDNEHLSTVEPDIQDLIARWAEESKRLLVALPGVLAKLDDLAAETDGLRRRLADLERENVALRQSREELAETFTKLRAVIAGTAGGYAAMEPGPARPGVANRHNPDAEPTPAAAEGATASPPPPAPERGPAPQPVSAEPDPRSESPADKPPGAKRDGSTPTPPLRSASVFRPPTRR